MPHVGVPRHVDARLIGIELPRMNVEHSGDSGGIVLAEGALDQPEWKMAEIRSARGGEAHPAPLGGRERQLGERSGRPVDEVRQRRRLRISVAGAMDGEEVVQLYVHKKDAAGVTGAVGLTAAATAQGAATQPVPLVRPIKQLKGFQRVSVAKGKAKVVTFTLAAAGLAFWDEDQQRFVVEPGVYEILVGASSEEIRVRGEVVVR